MPTPKYIVCVNKLEKVSIPLFVVGVVVLLSGCIGVVTSIVIEEDGSGTIDFNYRLSKLIAYIGADDAPERLLTIPVAREDFERALDEIPGAELSRFSQEDETEDVVIDVAIRFSDLETLESLFLRIDGPDLSFSREDSGETRMSLTIYDGLEAPADDTIAEMIRSFFSDYAMEWRVEAPSDIVSSSGGRSESNTAEIDFATHEVLLSESPVVWELEW